MSRIIGSALLDWQRRWRKTVDSCTGAPRITGKNSLFSVVHALLYHSSPRSVIYLHAARASDYSEATSNAHCGCSVGPLPSHTRERSASGGCARGREEASRVRNRGGATRALARGDLPLGTSGADRSELCARTQQSGHSL